VRRAVVMHEPWHQGVGNRRPIDSIRSAFQELVIRSLYQLSQRVIFTLPLTMVGWVPQHDRKSFFIPLGPNIPENLTLTYPPVSSSANMKTVSIFCLSNPPALHRELDDILHATRVASKVGLNLRIVFVGRGTHEASREIRRVFGDAGIRTEIVGLQEPVTISETLAKSDVLLCVRGTVNLRRSSALAGIACGVPVVGYSGDERGTPLVEAGLSLAPLYDRDALAIALSRVLQDTSFALELHQKNIDVQKKFFSWEKVASQYIESLQLGKN
jgi:glycosyltransferase involved in cell wall biosynthesis